LLADAAVRRALDRLFDRDGLARFNFQGSSEPTTGPFVAGGADADPAIQPRPFDPAAAQAELTAAGFVAGADGVLVRGTTRASFTLAFPTGGAQVYADVPPQLQEAARRAGVEVKLAPLPMAAFFEAGARRDFDAVLSLWQTSAVEPDLADTFRSDGAVSGGLNWSAVADPELDRLFDLAVGERNPARRSELRRRLHRRLFDEATCSFLFTTAGPIAVSRRFANVEIHELGVRYWDFVERARFEAEGLGR
jgi:peptide/nickel transport system substrate-binding protein